MGRKGRLITLGVVIGVVTAGLAVVSRGFRNWDLDDWKSDVLDIFPGSSEEPVDSSSSEEESSSSLEESSSSESSGESSSSSSSSESSSSESSSEEPAPDPLPALASYYVDSMDFAIHGSFNEGTGTGSYAPLTKNYTIWFTDSDQTHPVISNSARIQTVTTGVKLRIGWTTTVPACDVDAFKTGYTYAAYLIWDFSMVYQAPITPVADVTFNGTATTLTTWVRGESLTWAKLADADLDIGEHFQIAFVLNGNGQSKNIEINELRINVAASGTAHYASELPEVLEGYSAATPLESGDFGDTANEIMVAQSSSLWPAVEAYGPHVYNGFGMINGDAEPAITYWSNSSSFTKVGEVVTPNLGWNASTAAAASSKDIPDAFKQNTYSSFLVFDFSLTSIGGGIDIVYPNEAGTASVSLVSEDVGIYYRGADLRWHGSEEFDLSSGAVFQIAISFSSSLTEASKTIPTAFTIRVHD